MAERKSIFEEKSNEAHEQLFDYDFGWELCNKEWKEIVKKTKEAEEIKRRYKTKQYIVNPTPEHKKLLEANRKEIQRAYDAIAIQNVRGMNYDCQKLKDEGFFGLEHKKD